MQTFLCYPNFAESAACLDNRRLGKQRVECLQILRTLQKGPTEIIQVYTTTGVHAIQRKTPWYNHPAVRMWRGWELALALYAFIVCEEWEARGFKDSVRGKILSIAPSLIRQFKEPCELFGKTITSGAIQPRQDYYAEYDGLPPWLGDPAFHASHRSNLKRKDPIHYAAFTEPTTLPYVWPV